MKNRYTKLIGNSIIFAIANLGTKLIQFLMVPLYTYVLTKSEYGSVDILMTTVSMMAPIMSLSIFDAVFRFLMDKKSNPKLIFSNGMIVTMFGTVGIFILWIILKFMRVPLSTSFSILLALTIYISLLQNFAKSIGYIKVFAFSGMVSALATVTLSLVLILGLNMGITGYVISLILSSVITLIYLIFMTKVWKYCSIYLFNFDQIKKMLKYSIPLIPNAFSWWFTNDANRYFILFFVGASGNGLYAVANKIPSILTIFFGIFTQSWQLSAVEEFDHEDRDIFYSKIFNYLVLLSVIGASCILIILKEFMVFYTSPSFYAAWKIVPFLLLAACYSNIASFIGTIFLASKETVVIMTTTMIGMITNLILNGALIPIFGVNGAGIGSSLGFLLVAIIRIYKLKNLVHIEIDYYLILLGHLAIFTIYILNNLTVFPMNLRILIQCFILLIFIILFYKKYLFVIIKNILSMRGRR